MIRKLRPILRFGSSTPLASLLVAAFLLVLGEGRASAQAKTFFGDRGQLAITAENLFGLSFDRSAIELGDGTHSTASTRFGFLMSNRSSLSGASATANSPSFTPTGPWVGVHYFIIPNLSLGASLGIEWESASNTDPFGTNGTQTRDVGSRASFIFLPKVGYSLMLTDMMGFWFRGGPGISRVGYANGDDSVKAAALVWMLSLDALFVLTPVQHFAFYAGPQGNLSFAGSYSRTSNATTTSWDASFRNFAIGAGLIGYFDL